MILQLQPKRYNYLWLFIIYLLDYTTNEIKDPSNEEIKGL